MSGPPVGPATPGRNSPDSGSLQPTRHGLSAKAKVEGPMEAILLLLTGPLLALPRLSGEGALLSTHDWKPHVSVPSVGAPSGGPTFAPSCALAA